jgi:hypothetical protein
VRQPCRESIRASLRSGLLALALGICGSSHLAGAGAIIVTEKEFRPSGKDFPECTLADQAKISSRLLDFSSQLKIIQQYEGIYCIVLRDEAGELLQTLFVSGSFMGVYVGDVFTRHGLPVEILFIGDLFEIVSVSLMDGRLVMRSRCCAARLDEE